MVQQLVNNLLLTSAQLWCVSKQQNEIANTLKWLEKPDATDAIPKRWIKKKPKGSPKTNSNPAPEASFVYMWQRLRVAE